VIYIQQYNIVHNDTSDLHQHSEYSEIVYSAPDDGRKGLPKHVELLTPNKEHK